MPLLNLSEEDMAKLITKNPVMIRADDSNSLPHDAAQWRVHTKIEKYTGDWTAEQIMEGLAGSPYEIVEGDGNLLMTQGANDLLNSLIGAPPSPVYNNANAFIGVGDSNAVEAVGQTDLQASTNKVRVAMAATYPQVATNTLTMQAVFGTGVANFVWAEWAVFNASSAGHMLNRKVQANGTKASGSTWTFTITASLS